MSRQNDYVLRVRQFCSLLHRAECFETFFGFAIRQRRIRIDCGVELNRTRAEPERGTDLRFSRIDEYTHVYIFRVKAFDRAQDGLLIARAVESARGCDLARKLRHQRYLIRNDIQRYSDHLLGCGHLDIQLRFHGFPQNFHIAILNVPPVAAKMDRDTVSSRQLANGGGRNGIRLVGPSGLADCCDVVDVYRQKSHEYLPALAFQRIRTRSKSMRMLSQRNLTLLPSA